MLIDLKKEIPFWNENAPTTFDKITHGVEPIYCTKYKRKWSEMSKEDKWTLEEERWVQKAAEFEDKFGTIPPTGRSPKKHKGGSFNCLIDAFVEKQKSLPPEQRQSSCMIACSCRKCSPHM